MHSSGMRTIHCSSRLSQGALPHCMLGYLPPPGADPPDKAPPRPAHPGSRHPPEQTSPQTMHPAGDLLQGMLGYHLQGMLGYHPPPGQTHTCKSITFTTSLRMVMSCKQEWADLSF